MDSALFVCPEAPALFFRPQPLQVGPGRGLVDPQIEERGEGDDVREDFALELFVGNPVDIGREEIELHGQAPFRGLQLAHQRQHGVAYAGWCSM